MSLVLLSVSHRVGGSEAIKFDINSYSMYLGAMLMVTFKEPLLCEKT